MEININLDGVLLVANNLSDVANAASARLNIGAEPIITAGVNTQYWRGDKTWQTLNTTAVSEGINLYYTQARFDTAFAAKTTTNLNEGINLYFTEDKVRDTDLAGLSITGGSIGATDTVLEAFGKLQNQIAGLLGGAIVQGVWNATTNTPALASGVGTTGYYYVVNVAGSTNLDGITDWKVGDWAIFINGAWNKVDNTDAVSSVNGYVGAVSLVKSDIGLGNVENTALSTWAGSTNITTTGTIGAGTWNATTIGISKGGSGQTTANAALNAFLPTQSGATVGLFLKSDGTNTSWSAAGGGGIEIGVSSITSGTANSVLYHSAAGNTVAELANFTMGAVATGWLDVPVGYAIAGNKILTSGGTGNGTLRIGFEAGLNLQTGRGSTCVGFGAGRGAITGTENISLGAASNYGGGTFSYSLFIGSSSSSSAGMNNTASNQAVFGMPLGNGYTQFYFGQGVSAVTGTPAGVTFNATPGTTQGGAFSIRGGAGSGTDKPGGVLSLYGGVGTGNITTGGYISILNCPTVGASGGTAQTPTEVSRFTKTGDFVLGIQSDTKGLVLKSPDGHYWRITVDNAGVLSTADLGTSIPT